MKPLKLSLHLEYGLSRCFAVNSIFVVCCQGPLTCKDSRLTFPATFVSDSDLLSPFLLPLMHTVKLPKVSRGSRRFPAMHLSLYHGKASSCWLCPFALVDQQGRGFRKGNREFRGQRRIRKAVS